jgi:hypothetical protein
MKKLSSVALVVSFVCISGFAYAHDPSAPQDKGPFTLKKLTDDAYVLYGRGGNIGFAVTDEGVIVIDDQFADLAPGIAEQIKSVTSKPVRFLINTHHHGDNTGGNGFFIKMTTIIAHDNVRKHMLEAPQETIASAPRQIEGLQTRVDKLEKDDPQIARVDPASQFIPGHGEVTNLADLKTFKQYLLDLRAAVKKVVDQGMTREQALKEVKLEQYAKYTGYDQRFPGNVGTVYDEMKEGK